MSSLARDLRRLATGTGVALIITVLGIPILTRIYDPNYFSCWVMLASIWAVLSPSACLKFDQAIVLPKKEDLGILVWQLSLLMTIVMGVAISIGYELFSDFFLGEFGKRLSHYGPVLGIWIWSTGVYNSSLALFTRKKAFRLYAKFQMVLPALTIGSQIVIGFMGIRSELGLIAGAVGAQVVVGMVAGRAAIQLGNTSFDQFFHLGGYKSVWKKYSIYPTLITFYSMIGNFRERFILYVISNAGAAPVAAYYGLGLRVINVPNRIVSGSLRPIIYQRAAKYGCGAVENEIFYGIIIMLAGLLPAWSVFMLHSEFLFGFLFGESWAQGGYYVGILSIAAIPMVVTNWIDRLFDVQGAQRTSFFLELGFSLLVMASVLVLYLKNYPIREILIVQVGILTVYYWIWLGVLWKLGSYRFWRFWSLIGIYVGGSITMLGLAKGLSLVTGHVVGVNLGLVLGYLVAGLILLAFRRDIGSSVWFGSASKYEQTQLPGG